MNNETNITNPNKQIISSKINDIFHIPLYYHKDVKYLNNTLMTDLELIDATNKETDKPIYNYIFNPSTIASEQIVKQLGNMYTSNSLFLKQTQQLIHSIKQTELDEIEHKYKNNKKIHIDNLIEDLEEITEDTGFCEKYLYIDWDFGKMLNNNPFVLQIMGAYNIISPILSLCIPIIVLIIPFIIINASGASINFTSYINILKKIISSHAIMRIFTDFNSVDVGQKIYIVISAIFYLFSIYQNILICIKFYSNMNKIHNYLYNIKQYISNVIDKMNYYCIKLESLTEYKQFMESLQINIQTLNNFLSQLNKINLCENYTPSLNTIFNIGPIMHAFYQLYDNELLKNSIIYSLGFNGYNAIIQHINVNINNKVLNKTSFKKNKKNKITNMYYPKFINNKDKITNDCKLSKNIVITGPNASGKTTILKTALINTILSQQIGYGCFKTYSLKPYDFFHSYLNIPDTSGRDSLFQAEARRCKYIIEEVDNNKYQNKTHLCIFDELFSGTNHDEAVKSAGAFLDYISKKINVCCLLTTHYTEMCYKFKNNKNIMNSHMHTTQNENGDIIYTYKLTSGISNIKGGVSILKDMNYPSDILDKIM